MPSAFLDDRSLLRLGGPDAAPFLQALITTDIDSLPAGEARAGALLNPQGKILFDFLVSRRDDGFQLELDTTEAPALLKRLTLYRLRAAVTLEAVTPAGIRVLWGDDADRPANDESLTDGRFAAAGMTVRRTVADRMDGDGNRAAYDRLRIAHGIAEAGRDYAAGDAWPHDVLLDRTGGLSFRKGCYVGQEVVSRMQHRGTARRRVVMLSGEKTLTRGEDVTAAGKACGTVGTVCDADALAIVRIDRIGEALAQGLPIAAGNIPVTATLPAWSGLDFPTSGSDEP